MFKQIKSVFFWYYLYKFRKKVLLITFLLFIAFFADIIYVDIVEYLTLKNKLEYLEIALILKWLIIFFSILFSLYLFLGLFKLEKSDKNNQEIEKQSKVIIKKQKSVDTKFSKREEKFLNKQLKSKADILVEK